MTCEADADADDAGQHQQKDGRAVELAGVDFVEVVHYRPEQQREGKAQQVVVVPAP